MRFLNAPPALLRVLLVIQGVLYLIAGFFLTVFGTPSVTVGYGMAWVDIIMGFVLIGVAVQLVQLIATRSPIPYYALVAILLVRFVNNGTLYLTEGVARGPSIGMVVDVLLVAYLWSQIRRLQAVTVAA